MREWPYPPKVSTVWGFSCDGFNGISSVFYLSVGAEISIVTGISGKKEYKSEFSFLENRLRRIS